MKSKRRLWICRQFIENANCTLIRSVGGGFVISVQLEAISVPLIRTPIRRAKSGGELVVKLGVAEFEDDLHGG